MADDAKDPWTPIEKHSAPRSTVRQSVKRQLARILTEARAHARDDHDGGIDLTCRYGGRAWCSYSHEGRERVPRALLGREGIPWLACRGCGWPLVVTRVWGGDFVWESWPGLRLPFRTTMDTLLDFRVFGHRRADGWLEWKPMRKA